MKLQSRPEVEASHRPWPIPRIPWLMTQTWRNLLFAHWKVDPAVMRKHVPSPLQLDTFDGAAYLGAVPFRISDIRLHGLPGLPMMSQFNEINLRTYVTYQGKPGVLFLSMDADNPLAVTAARPLFRLPYTLATIDLNKGAQGYKFTSTRQNKSMAQFDATYKPVSKPYTAASGTLDHWLTERYCYYTATRGTAYRCEILHPPWPLQAAVAEVHTNTLAAVLGIETDPAPPVFHYSHSITALIWHLRRAGWHDEYPPTLRLTTPLRRNVLRPK